MLPGNATKLTNSKMEDFEDGEEKVGSFSIFFAEGEALAKQGQYRKAIESFTKALEFQAEDKLCLVARSRCYLQLGEASAALQDAEGSLKEDKKFHRGLYQKAEVLYSMGDFEYALVFYHRGHKIRPELHEFTLGIQKAQEAINNSIGSPTACKLEKIGDLSFFQQVDSRSKKKSKKLQKPGMRALGQLKGKADKKPVASEKTTKELLGELYADREYLERLVKDPGLVVGTKDRSIYHTVDDALGYLDARTEFWRQQKPMYARKREKELKKYRPSPTRPRTVGGSSTAVDHTKFVLKALEDIDNALASGDPESGLRLAEQVMKTVHSLSDQDLPNKPQFVSSLHSCIGNAHLDLGQTQAALTHHMEDLRIAEDNGMADARSRALDNLGRVYSVNKDYQLAIQFWQRKLPLVKSSEESTWLFHELGRCHLELEDYNEARDFGEKSLMAARDAQDQMWQLNASVLVAQAETKLGDFQAAVQSFERSLELAKLLDDNASQLAITKALEEVNARIVEELKPDSGEQLEGDAPSS